MYWSHLNTKLGSIDGILFFVPFAWMGYIDLGFYVNLERQKRLRCPLLTKINKNKQCYKFIYWGEKSEWLWINPEEQQVPKAIHPPTLPSTLSLQKYKNIVSLSTKSRYFMPRSPFTSRVEYVINYFINSIDKEIYWILLVKNKVHNHLIMYYVDRSDTHMWSRKFYSSTRDFWVFVLFLCSSLDLS